MADSAKTPLLLIDLLLGNVPDEHAEQVAEEFTPELLAAWRQFFDGVRGVLDIEKAFSGDRVVTSALRIVQAVAVAVRRKDGTALGSWEKTTLRYMKEHALEEYVAIPLPSRESHDRHLILAALRERVTAYLRQYKRTVAGDGIMEDAVNQAAASMKLSFLVQMAFPHLRSDEADDARLRLLDRRIEEHLEDGRPLADLDAEEVILDVLETLGVPRPAGWNWLKGAK